MNNGELVEQLQEHGEGLDILVQDEQGKRYIVDYAELVDDVVHIYVTRLKEP